MKRKCMGILAVLTAFGVVLGACGGSSTSNGDAEGGAPDGEVYTFNLQNHDSPGGATAQFLDAWAEEIRAASDGRIVINNFHGGSLGGPKDTYNMVVDGSVDIGWGLPSFYPGMFPATDAIALPFIGAKSSLQASYALWDLYDQTDYLKGEWSDVKVILLHSNCDAPLISNKKVEKAEDMKGMNLRINGGPPTEWAKLVGANPMNIGVGEIYTSMEKGVVSGVTSAGWDVVNAFRFYEQGKYFLDYAIHVNPYFLVMNQGSYGKLPDDLKAVIDRYSGYGALDVVGNRWAEAKADVFDKIKDSGGEIYKLPDAEQAKLNAFGEQARDIWISDLKSKGIDADGLVAKTMELLEKYEDKQ